MIRFAQEHDIPGIMKFIREDWKSDHILGTNEPFFRYEHVSEEGVAFVISQNAGGQIDAMLGYIPYGQSGSRDIMTVMWKANHSAAPSLGLELLHFLRENANVRILASPGSNPKLAGLYRYLGYAFGKMKQWYRLSPRESYQIAKISNADIPAPSRHGRRWFKLDTWEDFQRGFDFQVYQNSRPKPFKEPAYIRKRYYEHPIYRYEVYGVSQNEDRADAVFIFRVVSIHGASVIRWIDCIGNFAEIAFMADMTDSLLCLYGGEYMDCYVCGLPDQLFRESGWLATEGSGNVIPNYFSPFVQENIPIYYFSTDPEIVLFKGDGDQDRPN